MNYSLSTVLLFCATIICGADDLSVSRVMKNGVPLMESSDGKPFEHLIFAGSSLGSPLEADSNWQSFSYTAEMPLNDENAFIQINLASGKGTISVKDINFSELDDSGTEKTILTSSFSPETQAGNWKLIDQKNIGVKSSFSEDAINIEVPRRMDFPWSVQLCSPSLNLKEGLRYKVSFKLKTDSSIKWPVSSYLMRTNPLRFYGRSGEDQFKATAMHLKLNGMKMLSPSLAFPWPENPASYEDEMKLPLKYLSSVKADFPDSYLLIRIGVEPPAWWAKKYPEEMQKWENGRTANYVCVASEKWRSDLAVHLSRIIAILEREHGDRIVAYIPVGQSTGEWYYPIWENRDWGSMNHSEPFRKGYAAFLEGKYKNIIALNSAWHSNFKSFDSINVPSGLERKEARLAPFRDPAMQKNLFDLCEYQQLAMRSALEHTAGTIKKATGNKKLLFAFYGYSFELPGCCEGIAESGHLNLSEILKSQELDCIVDITSYYDRGTAGTGSLMSPVESITASGKLLCTEDDSRTHLSAPNAGYERTKTPEETRWTQARNLTRSLVHNAYTWKFDLYGSGWFNDKELWTYLAKIQNAFMSEAPHQFSSDTAVIIDEKSFMSLAPGVSLTKPLVYQFRSSFGRSGAGEPSWWLLDDLIQGKVPPHKLTIFLNAFMMDKSAKAAVLDYCRKSAGTAVWLYAPAYLSPDGEDYAGMESLTGFKFTRFKSKTGKSVSAELVSGSKSTISFPADLNDYFAVLPDESISVLARFPESNEAVLAIKQHQGFQSIFSAAPQISPETWADIAEKAGVWRYVDTGSIVITNGHLLSLTAARKSGDITIKFPKKIRLFDVDGNTILKDSDSYTSFFKHGESKIFIIKH